MTQPLPWQPSLFIHVVCKTANEHKSAGQEQFEIFQAVALQRLRYTSKLQLEICNILVLLKYSVLVIHSMYSDGHQ